MDKADLGLKFTCVNCAVRSFDLKRSPAVCPKCSTEQPVVRRRAAPGVRAPARAWAKHPVAVQRDPEAVEVVADDDAEGGAEDDDAHTIDADALDDDDEVEVIVPHVED